MNAGTVSRVLSLIPDRTARTQSGAAFQLQASHCSHPERLAHVSKFLNWMSPLDALSKDDQRELGLLAANGRPMQALDDDEEPEVDIAEPWESETPVLPAEQPVTL